VEDVEALALLRQFGCHEAQGYYFARPMDAQSLADYLRHMVQTPPNFENTGAL
jgi:EAL domain-containing protein (putative c-di-GMP-specific phosphodiesterase class I)